MDGSRIDNLVLPYVNVCFDASGPILFGVCEAPNQQLANLCI